MGETKTRFLKVTPRIVNGENRCVVVIQAP
jgi:hypothetical protein